MRNRWNHVRIVLVNRLGTFAFFDTVDPATAIMHEHERAFAGNDYEEYEYFTSADTSP
jgi:hypothetical protein